MGNINDTEVVMKLMREFAANMDMTHGLKLTEESLRQKVFEESAAQVLLAMVDGYAVGFALYYTVFSSFAGKEALYIEDIYITPLFRGRGYGRELMNVLREIAEREDNLRVEWKCLKWNQKAIDFYLRMGAELESENITFFLKSQ